jgi:excisionase family DNA binding protein
MRTSISQSNDQERPPSSDALLDSKQAAEYLNVAVKTLQNLRWKGGGPRFIKLGERLVRYRKSDLDQFVETNLRQSTSEGAAQ